MSYRLLEISDSFCILVVSVVGVLALFGGIVYNIHMTQQCTLQAMAMEKSADEIKKICYGR